MKWFTTTKTMKPCPFCGAKDIQIATDDGFRWYFALCAECGARGPEVRGAEAPIAAWNKRREVSDER